MAGGVECHLVAGHACQHVRFGQERRSSHEHPLDPRHSPFSGSRVHRPGRNQDRRSQRLGLDRGWCEFHESGHQHVERQRRTKAVPGGKFVNSSGQHTYVKFRWEGEHLMIDNTNVCHCGPSSTPSFSVLTKLALKIGWIVLSPTHSSGFQLGPNLQQEFLGDQIPTMAPGSGWNHLVDTSGNPVYWAVNARHYLDLSMSCSWRFTNLNTAFRSIVGEPTRSLHVYSDVTGSIVVGNRVTDLLREVMYQRKGRGSVYFEPIHIQYIPLRQEVVDIVETNVAETNGDLTKFGPGNTIVTLHFKKL